MSHFLHVCAGPYQFLLEAEGIHEVVEIGADSAEAAGRRDWRGRALATVNARSLLGMTDAGLPAEHAGVVYSAADDAAPVLIELDRVACLRRAERADFLPLPGVSDRVGALFDGVLPDRESGVQIYRLRRPLAADALVATAAAADAVGAEAATAAGVDIATPEVATPEVATPEVAAPEVAAPEVAAPEVAAPEVAAPAADAPPPDKRRRAARKRR